jgi:hypothetical protein
MANAHKYSSNKSGFKGVSWYGPRSLWQVHITIAGHPKHLGHFADPCEAARTYDRAAIRHFGVFARTNASMGLI